jgi:hypothetical protein
VFEKLISKLADADFDLPPVLKEGKLSYYVPIKRSILYLPFLQLCLVYCSPNIDGLCLYLI